MTNTFYEAAEDSELLLQISSTYLEKNLKKKTILEVGVGSGYVINSLAKKFKMHSYEGCDINKEALIESKKLGDKYDVRIQESNLFESYNDNKFDVVLFNAPYLPCEDGESYENLNDYDKALYGGEKGYEIILRFLNSLSLHLAHNGVCFLVMSSLSNLKVIEEECTKLLFNCEIASEENHFFEKIYCLKISKFQLLEEIENLQVTSVKTFSKGKHSITYKGIFEEKMCLIKVGAEQHLQKEILFTKKLEGETFAPNYYTNSSTILVREFIEGKMIGEFLDENHNSKEIVNVFDESFKICYELDKLGINKFEMTNPYKHIFICNDGIKMIDFERCIYSENPKNTRQFLQYVQHHSMTFNKVGIMIDSKKIEEIGRELKKSPFLVKISDLISQ